MAKVFLDTNYFIDIIHRKPEVQLLDSLENHSVHISPLSVSIYYYTFKIKSPNRSSIEQLKGMYYIDLSADILEKALLGPTSDVEDNIQLHSAALSECDYFLTNDSRLLSMKFFGKTKILSAME